jgi:hypothetical protein
MFVIIIPIVLLHIIGTSSTNDGYALDALEEPSLRDILTEHLRVHENMRDTPHFG